MSASEPWLAGAGDEELSYKLERCIYIFFVSGLSIFESFGFCLYFLGSTLQPNAFLRIAKPKKITLDTTTEAFAVAFPQALITQRLGELSQKPEFKALEGVRNVLTIGFQAGEVFDPRAFWTAMACMNPRERKSGTFRARMKS